VINSAAFFLLMSHASFLQLIECDPHLLGRSGGEHGSSLLKGERGALITGGPRLLPSSHACMQLCVYDQKLQMQAAAKMEHVPLALVATVLPTPPRPLCF
jgi:hypothetical protein